MSDCSLRSRGSRFEAAAFLSHSQTKSVSARSFVQDSGARSWALCFDCSLRSLWLALLAAAFLTRSQTGNVSAPSLVQDSGAPAWLTTADPIPDARSLFTDAEP
jgi:hypothetical protein